MPAAWPPPAPQPHAGHVSVGDPFPGKVETIARFYRRWYDGVGSKYWLICATGGKLYYHQEGSDVGWLEVPMPEDVDAYESDVWSWCTYEINVVGVDHPIDVLLMSNPKDGMIMVTPPDKPRTWDDIDAFTKLVWDSLNEDNKVSLFTRMIDIASGKYETRIVNKNQ